MKNTIKIFLLSVVIVLLSTGCKEKANYEDPEMTKIFIEKNKSKLEKIKEIDSYDLTVLHLSEHTVSYRSSNSDLNYLLSLLGIAGRYSGQSCQEIINITPTSLKFRESEVATYGKEFLYTKAQKCLDVIVRKIERDKLEDEKNKKISTEALNKKFDINQTLHH